MKKIVFLFCITPPFCLSSVYASGVGMSATRVIYNAKDKEASLTVQNKDSKEEYLIQTWIENADGNKKTPFIVTPPLFRLDPKKDNVLRIVNINNDFPADRETLYWLNVKAIPSASDNRQDKNVLQIAVRTRLKMFYRPAGLTGTPIEAQSTLTFKQEGSNVIISNPSAYNLPIYNIAFDKHDLSKGGTIPAKGQLSLPVPAGTGQAHQAVYTIINDFGAASESYTKSIQ